MASLEEHEKSMTLYYSKRTGEITAFSTGIQDMSFFGDNKEDYEIIWDFIVLEKDTYVLENRDKFKVVDGAVKLKESVDLTKYM
ncbi:hypothetical protein [Clostridium intestinale]|uniref:Uncharacterized protein n=1 Tax=Clostridium intestinale DSM 6191 TaxID=1121320 RepID=A0A1M5THS2_9CLOT|nr:hypothetical protein [Clostridium intestinale]SHH50200.1 hypothetical protein SAMN02745941_00217 [Clostridium intestinale DSM 6191]